MTILKFSYPSKGISLTPYSFKIFDPVEFISFLGITDAIVALGIECLNESIIFSKTLKK